MALIKSIISIIYCVSVADRASAERTAADIVDQFAERDAECGLEQSAVPDVAGKLDRHTPSRRY